MDRQRVMLAALASASTQGFSAVQVQKLFFLLDRTVPKSLGGPHFQFQPYHYGPFDKSVYGELELLRGKGMIQIEGDGSSRRYSLTPTGLESGTKALASLPKQIQEHVGKTAAYVRSLSFS